MQPLVDSMFIPQHLIQNASEYENEPAISWKNDAGDWDTMSWGEYGANAMNIAKSLIALGYEARENMSIYSYNRSDWFTCYHSESDCHEDCCLMSYQLFSGPCGGITYDDSKYNFDMPNKKI